MNDVPICTGALAFEAAAIQGIPGIFGLVNAKAVVAATGGVGEEDEFDNPVGENG